MNWYALYAGLCFLLVGGVANMTPVLVKKWNILNLPIDSYKKLRGKRILGDGKTWRGFILGTIAAGMIGLLLALIARTVWHIEVVNFGLFFFFGAYIGLCALLGDLLKSFVKRQVGIERGKSWFPFDQVDWVLGILLGLLCVQHIVPFHIEFILLLPIGVVLHLVVKFVGHGLKIENKPI